MAYPVPPLLVVLSVLLMGGCSLGIEKMILVEKSQKYGSINLVDGDVRVRGGRASKIKTVSAPITLSDGATVKDLSTVDGKIILSESSVEGNVEAVTGAVDLINGSKVSGNVGTVSGVVSVSNSVIDHDIEVVCGEIRLHAGATVLGQIIVKRNEVNSSDSCLTKIYLDVGSRVVGGILGMPGANAEVRERSESAAEVVLHGEGIKRQTWM